MLERLQQHLIQGPHLLEVEVARVGLVVCMVRSIAGCVLAGIHLPLLIQRRWILDSWLLLFDDEFTPQQFVAVHFFILQLEAIPKPWDLFSLIAGGPIDFKGVVESVETAITEVTAVV